MAETTCAVQYELTSKQARRKRIALRQFKVVTESPEKGKRRKLGIYQEASSSSSESDSSSRGESSGSDNFNSASSNGSTVVDNVCDDAKPVSVQVQADTRFSDWCPKYGITSVCGRRRDMEDAVSVRPSFCGTNFHFFGVFDGHGCSHVATTCKDRMHQIVKEEVATKRISCSEWKETMERSFSRMDKEVFEWTQGQGGKCRCEIESAKCDAGSTAVFSIVTPEKIVTANCGDSRAVLSRGGRVIPLSSDHKPDRPDELVRIEKAGGRVIYWDGPRVLGVLAMSRAIGDDYLKPFVSSEPEVTITDRTAEDECMIIASDGLWDVVSNETACSVARMCLSGEGPNLPTKSVGSDKACSDAALLLAKLAMARHSSDNVSVIVVDLKRSSF